ncbi:MAG: 1-acyl-sn-glycerol-3-phosphate acyltransferase [Candidatus Eisenbacteria bacterium]|nr:1-acyl-sn-glycerol-3-phosphate acyltransferase [Candidatus Eisenbacteria bacterium]
MRPWYRFILALARWILRGIGPMRVIGREHLPRGRNFIMASNHFSFFEPPILGVASHIELHYFAKQKLFEIPVFGRLIRSVNAVPINRGSTDLTGLNGALEVLRAGGSLVIFPEGGRNRTGRLKPPKGGIGYLALGSGVPIVPAYVRNSNRMLNCTLRRSKITVAFGPPLEPDPELLNLERKEAHRRIGRAVMDQIALLEQQVLALETGTDGATPKADSAPGPGRPGPVHP